MSETLTLHQVFGFAGGADTFKRISWLYRCRLADDRVQIIWEKPDRGELVVPVRELVGVVVPE